MTNGSNDTETPRQKLAQAARQDDMKSANEGARTSAQTAVLINGGAATAVLAFLSTYLSKGTTTPSLPIAIPLSLFGYALGVCIGAWSMWSASQACGQFGLRWETFLDTQKAAAEKDLAENKYLEAGKWWLTSHHVSFALSIVLFLVSSAGMACGIFASAK